tara:strand:+ start:858 stop:1754 length:897 start_codon:yes stop_codon:yes gene_type:complete
LKNNTIHYWACDDSPNTGEGKLCLFFLKDLQKIGKIKNIKKENPSAYRKNFKHRYILPFIGIFYCWKYYFKNKNSCYINYLPLWNFLIFLLLPPKTIVGPITGGAKFNDESFFIRSYIFPIFYKISELIINIRKYDIIFSTALLKKYLTKNTIRKSNFNYILKKFNYKKKKFKKSIDFLVYYRNHKNKKSLFPKKFIHSLIRFGFKVNVIGDKLDISSVTNHGFVDNNYIAKLQSKAKYTIASAENLYSLFTLECITQNVRILVDKSDKLLINFYKDSFLRINFKNHKEFNKMNISKL